SGDHLILSLPRRSSSPSMPRMAPSANESYHPRIGIVSRARMTSTANPTLVVEAETERVWGSADGAAPISKRRQNPATVAAGAAPFTHIEGRFLDRGRRPSVLLAGARQALLDLAPRLVLDRDTPGAPLASGARFRLPGDQHLLGAGGERCGAHELEQRVDLSLELGDRQERRGVETDHQRTVGEHRRLGARRARAREDTAKDLD